MLGSTLKKSLFILSALLTASFNSTCLAASCEDLQTLEMYYKAEDLVVSATRNPKPLSQSAENITVITAKEIEMMGAHTLVDVFANVPGIQSADMGGPGLANDFFFIQGADFSHTLVMLDGVTLNFFGNPFVDIGGIAIQNIERIEIVKGPGSSSWGSALGGVINIVTKSPVEEDKFGGRVSFSGGERGTRDTRGEVSGTVAPFGYYLYAGNLRSEGFHPNTAADQNDYYAKLRLDLPNSGTLQFSIAYDRAIAGLGTLPYRLQRRYFLSTLSLNYPVTDNIDLALSLRTLYKMNRGIATPGSQKSDPTRETTNGWSVNLNWREGINSLAIGADYDHIDSKYKWFHRFSDKYGVFLNDTLSLGDFSITPGIRYDLMRPVGDFYSPSLGIAWNPTSKITLRAYAARGYSLPLLCPVFNAHATQSKVTTVQSGVETTYIPWLWLKATFFWNHLSDIEEVNYYTQTTLLHKQLKQGVEVEGKTIPILNTAFSAGYTFIDTKDRESGETLQGVPRQIVKLGIHYDDDLQGFRGSLLGRYSWLNMPADYNGKYNAMIWDLNLAKQFIRRNNNAVEIYFNAHNLFNGSQYNWEAWQNARRWFEGGIRFDF